ncbi:MAG TPA: PQQ-dependent sugar dehydrogenase [Candidatus Limnocylindria bacterium]|nr:PQQ-dependent sugar dehydrogenase [Candidatus Limnocylindria bacterium]
MRRALLPLALVLAACASVTTGAPPASPGATASGPAAGLASTRPSPTASPSPTPQPKVPTLQDVAVQSGLSLPWDLAFAPDGRMFVTERVGNLLIFESGATNARRLANIPVAGVRSQGESGLMGIALDPDFARNGLLYLCASRVDQGQWLNQVLRYRADGNAAAFDGFVIREGMRAQTIHDGCRLAFGPDRKLWVTMGESGLARLAQDPGSLNGKVLRVNTDGSVPDDNPTLPGARERTVAYSMGHRNPQGLAFHPTTHVAYEVEHGDDVHDEINILRPGANYGWPQVEGPNGAARGFIDPVWSSGPVTLATSGAAFVVGAQWGLWAGSLFVAQLKEMDLRRFTVEGDQVRQAEVLLDRRYGRLRSPVLGPDGNLYVTTSNGAGDRIVRISASQ